MIRVFLICLACCCSSLMPLKQCESIVSEDHIQVVERKSKNNYFSGQDGINFVASDFLSYDFGRIFYDYIKDFESPRTENLSYNRSYTPINYEFISDSPIGHMHLGGFSNNLISSSGFSSNGTYSYLQLDENTYTLSLNNISSSSIAGIYFGLSTGLNIGGGATYTWIIDNGNVLSNSITLSNCQYVIIYPSSNSSISSLFNRFNIMLNYGSNPLPYEPYFTGVVQYASLPCYSFTLDKELLFNSQYNGYCYHYLLNFYSRNPNGRPLLFGVDSYVIPHLKWEDSQGNIYGDNFYVVSKMIFNDSLSYNLNNFVYSERSNDSYKPLLNCYANHKTSEFNSDDYVIAYNDGYDTGYNNGNSTGYQRGYSEGVSYAQEQSSTALTIFTGIIEVGLLPVNVFLKMFEYEVFGINIAGLVSGLITIAMIMILLRFIFGGKQNGK